MGYSSLLKSRSVKNEKCKTPEATVSVNIIYSFRKHVRCQFSNNRFLKALCFQSQINVSRVNYRHYTTVEARGGGWERYLLANYPYMSVTLGLYELRHRFQGFFSCRCCLFKILFYLDCYCFVSHWPFANSFPDKFCSDFYISILSEEMFSWATLNPCGKRPLTIGLLQV